MGGRGAISENGIKYKSGKFKILNKDGSIGIGEGKITQYNGTKYGIKNDYFGNYSITHIDSGASIGRYNSYKEAIKDLKNVDKKIKENSSQINDLVKEFKKTIKRSK